MARRLLPLLLVAVFLAGTRAAAAQPSAPRLSAAAQALAPYLPTSSDYPPDFRPVTQTFEVGNEEIVGAPGGADMAPAVVNARRTTGVVVAARGPSAVLEVSI